MKKILLSAILLGGITFGTYAQATKKAETKRIETTVVKPAAPSSEQAKISVKKTEVKKVIKVNTAVGKKRRNSLRLQDRMLTVSVIRERKLA